MEQATYLHNRFFKRKLLLILFSLILLMMIVFFCAHNFYLYQQTIVKVTDVETAYTATEIGPNQEKEAYYHQSIEAVVKNGPEKGATVSMENSYAASGIKGEKYSKGDCLFVTLAENNGTFSATVTGVKRDVYFCLLLGILALSLLLTSSRQGFLTLVSIVVNVALFTAWISFNGTSVYNPKNWVLIVISFCLTTLLLVSGFHKKTFAAIISSLLSVGAIYGLYQLVAAFSAKLPFELVTYMTGPDSAEPIFIISLIVGSLGAVMDVAVTICSSVGEMVHTKNDIALGDLIRGIREIAMDIMGTMINVLFFSYLSGALFMIVLEVKNDYSISSLFQFSFIFEVVRFLTGSIGIVLAIPLAAFTAILFYRKEMGAKVL
ncbi:MAG TPA: YibE/F family protein [Clostridiales bacterium]|nr:YibE/F family protein [Clostridiales bacterium]